MATIRDVARLAEVSVSTVSRVINQSGYAGVETKEKVLKAMNELGFTPNSLAKGLVSGKTGTIGLLIPDVSNPFYAEVSKGVEDFAIKKGYTVILCNFDWKTEREKTYLNILRQKWVDGVIVAGSKSEDKVLKDLIGSSPFVVIDRRNNPIGGSVWMNNEAGAMMATQYLFDTGCRNIVHISGPEQSPSAYGRKTGFLRTIELYKKKGVQVKGSVLQGNYRFEGGYRIGQELMKTHERPDGIFAGNDLMAIGVIQAIQSQGYHIPKDISVIGFDNIAMGQYIAPKLTTIDQPGYEMGKAGFELLHETIQSGDRSHREIEFQPQLIIRKSTCNMLSKSIASEIF